MTAVFLFIAYFLLVLYAFLQHFEVLVVKRINDFYIITYGFPRPMVCLRMSRKLRRKKLPQKEVQRRLSRCTSFLCKQLPPGTYLAHTHDRVLEGLRHMEQKGRAKVLQCRPKGRPKKPRKVYRHVFGRRFNAKELPRLQMHKVVFSIH